MSASVRTCPLQSVIVANAVLLLLNVACHLLDRQLARLAADFENEGGFSERMYQQRLKKVAGTQIFEYSYLILIWTPDS